MPTLRKFKVGQGLVGMGGLSATGTAYRPLSRVWILSQLISNQQHTHLVEIL